MNLHTTNNIKNNKKYVSSDDSYCETNKRSREEFAKGFIKSYDGVLKKIIRGERGKDAEEFIKELKKEMQEEE